MQSNNKTWHSCFQCHYSHVDSNACTSLNERDRQLLQQCNNHFGFGALSVSNYAAQLAWWLNFFTPDRFLIISSRELRDEENRLKVRLLENCEGAITLGAVTLLRLVLEKTSLMVLLCHSSECGCF